MTVNSGYGSVANESSRERIHKGINTLRAKELRDTTEEETLATKGEKTWSTYTQATD